MIFVVYSVVCLVSVPLAGGRLSRLADVRVRRLWTLGGALLIQVLIISVVPGGTGTLHKVAHVGSYLMAGWFVVANRRIPGMLLIGGGGLGNLLAIAANGGIMPASASALATAGVRIPAGQFVNSATLPDPNLAFLGDIFAIPQGWPLANVFSIGDLCIALGVAVAMHRLAGSRLVPSGSGQFSQLRNHPNFLRVWGAQAVSNMGDWVYSLAVWAALARRGAGPEAFGFLLVAQMGPAAVAGLLVGPLVDRFSRKRLMIAADLARAASVGSLFLTPNPSMLHLFLVAGCLGLFGSVFQPSLHASLPNLVPRERLIAANALVSATYNLAVMAGPIVGGLLVARLGSSPAFAINASTFIVSAILLSTVRLPDGVNLSRGRAAPLRDLRDGIRYTFTTPLIRGALIVVGMVMLGSAIRSPLESVFVLSTLDGRPESLGLVGGAWGLGMLLGSFAAPSLARRWARERLIGAMVMVVGLAVIVASRSQAVGGLLMLWLVSGAANGVGAVSFDSLLQERTPDRVRGRIMAASEAVTQGAFLAGAAMAGWTAAQLGVRGAFLASGLLLLATAMVSRRLLLPIRGRHRATLGRHRRRGSALDPWTELPEASPAAEPAAIPTPAEPLNR